MGTFYAFLLLISRGMVISQLISKMTNKIAPRRARLDNSWQNARLLNFSISRIQEGVDRPRTSGASRCDTL